MGSPGARWALRSWAVCEGLADSHEPRAVVRGTFCMGVCVGGVCAWGCPSLESSLFEERMVLGERSPQPPAQGRGRLCSGGQPHALFPWPQPSPPSPHPRTLVDHHSEPRVLCGLCPPTGLEGPGHQSWGDLC